jgi:hypothetical protein
MADDDQIRVYFPCGPNYQLGRIAVPDVVCCRAPDALRAFHASIWQRPHDMPPIVGNERHPFDDRHVLGKVCDCEKMDRRTRRQGQALRLGYSFVAIGRPVIGHESFLAHGSISLSSVEVMSARVNNAQFDFRGSDLSDCRDGNHISSLLNVKPDGFPAPNSAVRAVKFACDGWEWALRIAATHPHKLQAKRIAPGIGRF